MRKNTYIVQQKVPKKPLFNTVHWEDKMTTKDLTECYEWISAYSDQSTPVRIVRKLSEYTPRLTQTWGNN